jgi:ComEC/Rec2-related protein
MSAFKKQAHFSLYVLAIIILFSSIYLARYTRYTYLRQKVCQMGTIEQNVGIIRRPLEKVTSTTYDDGEFRYIFSRNFHPRVGDSYKVIGAINDAVQCKNSDKIVLKVQHIEPIEKVIDSVSFLHAQFFIFLDRLQTSSEVSLSRFLSVQQRQLLFGILLGKKIDPGSELSQTFLTAGVVHVIVASGTNVALFAGLAHAVMRQIFSRKMSFIAAFIFVFTYAVFMGFQPPILRAVIMFFLVQLTLLIGRPHSGILVLAWTVGIMLIYQPFLIYSLSFQLTVAATLGILLAPVRQQANELYTYIDSTFFTSLVIFFFTLPLLIVTIGTVNLITIISSIATLWIVPVLTLVGFPLLVLSVVTPPLFLMIIAVPSVILLELFSGIINLFSSFPYAQIEVSPPSAIGLIGYYGCLLAHYWLSSSSIFRQVLTKLKSSSVRLVK